MHVMLQNVIYLNRAEGSKSYMQCNSGNIYAFFLDLLQQFRCKMQSRCRCSRRSGMLGIYSLVTVLILQLMRDVRW